MTNPIVRIERHDYRDPMGHPLVNDVDWKAITQADKARGEVVAWIEPEHLREQGKFAARAGYGMTLVASTAPRDQTCIPLYTTPQPQGDASPLEKRIADELTARQSQCGVSGCTNQATHTWSGHPTCDDCGTPGRTKLDVPAVHAATPQVSGGGESVAGYIDRLGERIRQGMADVRRFGINGSHALYMDRLADEAIEYAANLSTPQARPDGGEAVGFVDEGVMTRGPNDPAGPGRYISCARMSRELPAGTKLYTHPTPAPDVALLFTDATIDKMQDVMAMHGFAVPVRVISDAFHTTLYVQQQGATNGQE